MRLISWLAVENLFNLAHSHFRSKSSLCTAQLDGSISDTKSRGKWFLRGQKFLSFFFFCVCLLQWRLSFSSLNWYIFRISLIRSWTSGTLVEAQRIKARFRSYHFSDLLIISDLVPPGLVGDPAHCAPSQVPILCFSLFVTICCFSVFSSHDCNLI